MKKTSKAVRTHKHSFRRYTAGMLAALMILGGIDPAGISTIITMAQESGGSGQESFAARITDRGNLRSRTGRKRSLLMPGTADDC